MEWLDLGAINWLGVLLAFLATFVVGWLWYSEWGFFKPWAKAGELTREKMEQANMAVAFGGTIVANLLGIVLVAALMAATGATSAGAGALLGAVLGLIMRGGAHFLHNGFAARHWKVSVLDTAHDTVALALAGLILGAMA